MINFFPPCLAMQFLCLSMQVVHNSMQLQAPCRSLDQNFWRDVMDGISYDYGQDIDDTHTETRIVHVLPFDCTYCVLHDVTSIGGLLDFATNSWLFDQVWHKFLGFLLIFINGPVL